MNTGKAKAMPFVRKPVSFNALYLFLLMAPEIGLTPCFAFIISSGGIEIRISVLLDL